MSWYLKNMYGLDTSILPSKGANYSNPDYQAGSRGDTVGGLGNTAGFGQDVKWTNPVLGQAVEGGEILSTHKGDYRAVYDETSGTYSLQTVDGTGGINVIDPDNKFYNIAHGDLHVGINPYTGEMWYQRAQNLGDFSSGFSGGNPAGTNYTPSNPNDPTSPDAGPVEEDNSGSGDLDNTGGDTLTSGGGGGFAGGGSYAGSVQTLGYNAPSLTQVAKAPKVDYVKMLNGMLAADVMSGMMTGRKLK